MDLITTKVQKTQNLLQKVLSLKLFLSDILWVPKYYHVTADNWKRQYSTSVLVQVVTV